MPAAIDLLKETIGFLGDHSTLLLQAVTLGLIVYLQRKEMKDRSQELKSNHDLADRLKKSEEEARDRMARARAEFEENENQKEREFRERLHELDAELKERERAFKREILAFAASLSARNQWAQKRREEISSHVRRIRDSLIAAVDSFKDLADGSAHWDNDVMVERSAEALDDLCSFRDNFSAARPDLPDEFRRKCEDIRKLFARSFLALNVDRDERRKPEKSSEIYASIQALLDVRAEFEVSVKIFEESAWEDFSMVPVETP